jgi:lipoate-protein ligase A
MQRSVTLLETSFADRPAFDTGLSRALLEEVAAGTEREALRLHTPGDVVAFSVLDRARPGFDDAVVAARDAGFGAILRLAGGRAAVFHAQTIAFAWCIADPEPRNGIRERFEETAGIIVEALASLGVDARIGEVEGEYCPGEHSVNARGRAKLMGVGQRVVRGSAHVGGVIVVGASQRVRDALVPVYDAMGFEWDPSTVGAIEDEVPGVTSADVLDALRSAWGKRVDLEPGEFRPSVLEAAEERVADHTV